MRFQCPTANRKSQPGALNQLAIEFEDLGRKAPGYLGAMLPISLQNDGGYRGVMGLHDLSGFASVAMSPIGLGKRARIGGMKAKTGEQIGEQR
jgi:hypothetical protein